MNTHTKRQAVFLTRLGPLAHDIPFRPHVHRVPRLVLAVPKVHIIMMVTQCHEITGTHALVKTYQRIRLPLFGLPFINHVLKPEILRITIFFHVHVILPMTPDSTCDAHTNRPTPVRTAAPNAPKCRIWHRETNPDTHTLPKIPTSVGICPSASVRAVRFAVLPKGRMQASPPHNTKTSSICFSLSHLFGFGCKIKYLSLKQNCTIQIQYRIL